MRKIISVISVVTLVLFVCYSAQAQSTYLKKGLKFIDVYYGGPNFYPNIIQKGYNNSFDLTRGMRPDYKTSNFNPIGFKYEQLFSDNLGVGVNVFYAKSVIEWNDVLYNYTSTISRLRVAVTYNYHIPTTTKFDPYFMLHLGYAHINYEFDQESKIDSIPAVHPKPEIKFNYPITVRAGFGCRYFFTDDFGINAEVGIGGVFASGGLSYKF